ncbi:MAG TPA: patatin-like phospholipase family protein [Polyangiaceae bacterium]|nr:patatin-like phospholipase family protein [Polyangiaceae bacterium]
MSPRIALCLPGGGAMGALYQIGALAAVEDAVEGFDANSFDLYVGSSSGASLSAVLSAGVSVQRLYRAFLDPADVYFGLERKHLLRIDLGEWRRTLLTAMSALRHAAGSALTRESKALPSKLWQELDRLYDSLPAGLFTLEGYERFLEDFFVRRGVPNVFAAMPRPLYVLSHELESGAPVCFGSPLQSDVPVTRACIASMAIPPFFSPVRIGDKQYINPGAGQISHLDVAVEAGAEVLFVVHSMVPVCVESVPTGHGPRTSLRDKGMMWVLNQGIRIGMQRLVDEATQRVVRDRGVAVLRIEPEPADGILFMDNSASFEARRRLLEHAYRSTRLEMARRFAAGDESLQRACLKPRQNPRTVSPPAA